MNDKKVPLFRLRDLRYAYGGQSTVEIPSLDLEEGQIHAVCGPNGSGKTTLLKLLNGLLEPTGGEILFRGEPLDLRGYARIRGESVLVHQDPYLFDGTVARNLAFALKIRKLSSRLIQKRIEQKLSLVGLPGFEHRRSRALSVGEKQRVAIARALALEPGTLFLDEPTANMDAASTGLLERLILRLADAGTTIIFSSHHRAFAYRLGTRLVFLEEGTVVPGRENVFKGTVENTDDRFSYFQTGTQTLRCPAQEGRFTTAVLPLDDVILSQGPVHTSAQNRFLGRVVNVEKTNHTVRVSLDCGFPVQALITEYSVDTLKVVPGERFYVTFKASAIRLY